MNATHPTGASTHTTARDPEIVAIHPRRTSVSREAWHDLFAGARQEIGVLVYAGAFLAADDELMRLLAAKAAAGARVRILLGDPDADVVARRGDEEGIDGRLAAMARTALARHRELLEPHGAQIRLHATVLYTSIYRGDDDLLANQHVLGVGAADAPVMHLRRSPGGQLFDTYQGAFELVWSSASPPR